MTDNNALALEALILNREQASSLSELFHASKRTGIRLSHVAIPLGGGRDAVVSEFTTARIRIETEYPGEGYSQHKWVETYDSRAQFVVAYGIAAFSSAAPAAGEVAALKCLDCGSSLIDSTPIAAASAPSATSSELKQMEVLECDLQTLRAFKEWQASKMADCETCNDHGSVGRAPDDYVPCPDCTPAPTVMDEKGEALVAAFRSAWKVEVGGYSNTVGRDVAMRVMMAALANLPAVQPEAETSAEKALPKGWRKVLDDLVTNWATFEQVGHGRVLSEVRTRLAALESSQADAPVAEPVALTDEECDALIEANVALVPVIDSPRFRSAVTLGELRSVARAARSSATVDRPSAMSPGAADSLTPDTVGEATWAAARSEANKSPQDFVRGAQWESRRIAAKAGTWPSPDPRFVRLAKAAIDLITEVHENHDTKEVPLKYTVPWGAVVNLRNALGATGDTRPPAPEEGKDAARKPLTDDVISNESGKWVNQPDHISSPDPFKAGVRWAEKQHGITDAAMAQGEKSNVR